MEETFWVLSSRCSLEVEAPRSSKKRAKSMSKHIELDACFLYIYI